MPLESSTYTIMSEFAEYCRTGRNDLKAGHDDGGARQYRRLTLNIIDDSLQRAFPILKSRISDEQWESLVTGFVAEQELRDPELWKMPKQLLQYARVNNIGKKLGVPELDDLLLFEWTEVELFMMPDLLPVEHFSAGDLWQEIPVLNPEFKLLALSYPVFRVSDIELAQRTGEYFLLLFRHPESGQVHFIELSKLFAEIVRVLACTSVSGAEACSVAAKNIGIKFDSSIEKGAREFLTGLAELKMIFGVSSRTESVNGY